MLISLIVVIISQYMHISKYHIVHLNYIQLLVKKNEKKKINTLKSVKEIESIIFIKQRKPHFLKVLLVKILNIWVRNSTNLRYTLSKNRRVDFFPFHFMPT